MKVHNLLIPVSAVVREHGDPGIRLTLIFIYAGTVVERLKHTKYYIPEASTGYGHKMKHRHGLSVAHRRAISCPTEGGWLFARIDQSQNLALRVPLPAISQYTTSVLMQNHCLGCFFLFFIKIPRRSTIPVAVREAGFGTCLLSSAIYLHGCFRYGAPENPSKHIAPEASGEKAAFLPLSNPLGYYDVPARC